MKMGLKQVQSDPFKVLFVLVEAKRYTYATLEAEQENGLKTS